MRGLQSCQLEPNRKKTARQSAIFWRIFSPHFAERDISQARNRVITHSKQSLRVCPREHQAVVLHTISPISVKFGQFKGSIPKLKKTNWFLFWFFPGRDRQPPRFFLVFTREIASKQVKCMKLSLPWYLTNYSEGLHTYYYILSKCPTQVSVNLIDGLSINRGK